MSGPNRAHTLAQRFSDLYRAVQNLTGRRPSDRQREQFEQYLNLLVRWNKAQRLTGVRSPEDIVQYLFYDSLVFLAALPNGQLAVADFGAGSGIPGIPLAIVRRNISMALIESKRKRVSFLNAVNRELNIENVVVIEGRAEDLAATRPDLCGAFDAVVSRAVGAAAVLPIAMRYLKIGGAFIASGPPMDRAGAGGRPGTSTARTASLTEPGTILKARMVSLTESGPKRVLLVSQKRSLDTASA